MSEAKFRNGPWSTDYRKDFRGMYNQDVFDKNGENICQCCWYPVKEGNAVTTTNREANANLIAAAPEMYEMLESLREDYGLLTDVGKNIDELLAKARGEA